MRGSTFGVRPGHAWDALVLGTSVVTAFVIPLRVVLPPEGAGLGSGWEVVLTLLYAVDFVVRLRRSGDASKATRIGWLASDAAAVLPLDALTGVPFLALLRLTKLARLAPLMGAVRLNVTMNPTLVRLGAFGFVLAISAHWIACGWLWLGGPSNATGSGPYLGALYWCITTLTTVGYGDVTPTSSAQTIYAMAVVMLGVGLYGFVIGNVATLLTRVDMARAQYLATLDRLTGFLRYHRIPAELQRHIFEYYKYLWERRMGYDERSLIEDLPASLRRELSLVLKGDLIQKMPFLEGASRELVHDLCRELQPVVFTPGDVIIRAGEPGRHVYFVSSGTVEVLDESGALIRTLSDGEIFGELALLHDRPRSATVRAVGYCDLYTLDREAFARTLSRYPTFAEHIATLPERLPDWHEVDGDE